MKAPALRRRIGATLIASTFAVALPALAQNAAVVNNKPIPQKRVDDFVDMLKQQGRPDSPELRAAVREELIARELFTQEAEKIGLARSADVQRQLDQAKQDILIRALIRDYVKKHPIKDEDIAAEYEKIKTQFSGEKEYRARHILVEKEDTAKQIIADLKKGSKFEDLAKQSKDTGSAANGGDLDWNPPGTFVKEFSEAMVKLEKGKYTEAPVKSQFGFHVIRLDDVRDSKAPPLEQVKPQLQQEMERRQVQQLQQDLRAKAKIQ
ncbi:MAG TPA: peptidylprolyl isomerase [Burkholderiaceae bacterium]|nr:peptidylprolyl isomerase [Burkholderiaceae bacterium]